MKLSTFILGYKLVYKGLCALDSVGNLKDRSERLCGKPLRDITGETKGTVT